MHLLHLRPESEHIYSRDGYECKYHKECTSHIFWNYHETTIGKITVARP